MIRQLCILTSPRMLKWCLQMMTKDYTRLEVLPQTIESILSKIKKKGWIDVSKFKRNDNSFTIFQNKLVMISSSRLHFYFSQLNGSAKGPEFNQNRYKCAVVSHYNCLYVLGGNLGSNRSNLQSTEKLLNWYLGLNNMGIMNSPTLTISGDWWSIESMQKGRSNFAAVSCREYIYAIGGQCNNTSVTKTVERYDPDSNNWTYVEEMEFEKREHAACVLDGKIHVVGGRNGDKEAVKAIECYDPDDNSWSVVGETTDELYGHTVIPF